MVSRGCMLQDNTFFKVVPLKQLFDIALTADDTDPSRIRSELLLLLKALSQKTGDQVCG